MGELNRARDYGERTLNFQERASNVWAVTHALASLGLILIWLGTWDEARRYLDRGVELAGDVMSSWWGVYPLMQLGYLLVVTGEWEEARRTLEAALAGSERNKDLQAESYTSAALASLDLAEGHPEAATVRLESLLKRSGWDHKDVAQLLPVLAESYLVCGLEEMVEAVVREAIQRSREQVKLHLPNALRVEGMLRTAQARWDEANGAFEEALSLARAMPYPFMEARILYEQGRMYGRVGEPRSARQQLEQGLAIFQRLGARHSVESTYHALGALE
jgi:tetratricopeptide (TPR) repeat protein